MQLVDNEFKSHFATLSEREQGAFVFLEQHPELDRFWLANCVYGANLAGLAGLDPARRYVSLFRLRQFSDACAERGLQLVYFDDPKPVFSWFNSLSVPPDVEINSDFPGTIRGLLPFQVQGYNFCRDLPAAVLNASTGTGKSLMACALTKYHLQEKNFDLFFWVVKAHNKINSARFLERFAGIEATIIDGSKTVRTAQLTLASKVIVLNYEVFRTDGSILEEMIADKRIWICWDEMPTKLKSRQTQLYRAVCKTLYTSHRGNTFYPSEKTRPAKLHQIMLSATPIEGSPQDFYNAVRILKPDLYGAPRRFNDLFIAHRNAWGEPDRWQNLDLMGAMASAITFQVEKTSPDIAAQFPEINYEDLLIDISPDQRRLYRAIMGEYQKMRVAGASVLTPDHILSAIQVLQYVCDYPPAVVASARLWDASQGQEGSEAANLVVNLLGDSLFLNAENVKLDVLHEIIQETTSKIVLFMPYNQSVMPHLSRQLDDWGISHVCYHGELSMKEKQAAQDTFTDTDCRLFLSSDAGSDSINLEAADTVINFSLPWNWSTLTQRSNRIHRLSSTYNKIHVYTFLCANTVETRKMDILVEKYNYHKAVLQGDVQDQAEALRSGSDLQYILYGD